MQPLSHLKCYNCVVLQVFMIVLYIKEENFEIEALRFPSKS